MVDAFDHRPFVRLDHGMPENSKVVGLSDASFRLFVEAICWCSRQEEDGEIPEPMMRRLGTVKGTNELLRARLLERTDTGYLIHDYLHFQRSKAEIDAFRRAKGEAGKLGNHERWHVARRKRDKDCEFCLKGIA